VIVHCGEAAPWEEEHLAANVAAWHAGAHRNVVGADADDGSSAR